MKVVVTRATGNVATCVVSALAGSEDRRDRRGPQTATELAAGEDDLGRGRHPHRGLGQGLRRSRRGDPPRLGHSAAHDARTLERINVEGSRDVFEAPQTPVPSSSTSRPGGSRLFRHLGRWVLSRRIVLPKPFCHDFASGHFSRSGPVEAACRCCRDQWATG
jgi:hypothetical protein